MSGYLSKPCAAFDGVRMLASGPLVSVVLAVKDATGRVLDFHLRGSKADIVARLQPAPAAVGARHRTATRRPVPRCRVVTAP